MSAPLSIAFIGTGVMGRSMAGHLQKAGHRLHVFNRSRDKAQALLDAFTIRERVRIKGEIKTLTAQQRMSGYVVGLLPVALFGLLSVMSPTFITPMFMSPPDVAGIPLGIVLLSAGVVLMGIGFLIIRRIVDIRV